MSPAILLLSLAISLSIIMSFAWWIVSRGGKSGWVDAIWSFSVGLGGVSAAFAPFPGDNLPTRQLIVAAICAIWSLRLSFHITWRTYRGGDDPRYAQLREEWGPQFKAKLFWFLQVQAVAAFLLVLCILVAAHHPAPRTNNVDLLGVMLLVGAIIGETISDRQLRSFSSNPTNKGMVCDRGLWRWTRHPNYFFEWLVWIGYVLIALHPAFVTTYLWGWLALTGPIFMYWLLVHVSGIPPLESHMLRSRGDAYRVYQARTNRFWPGPTRTSKTNNHGEQSL